MCSHGHVSGMEYLGYGFKPEVLGREKYSYDGNTVTGAVQDVFGLSTGHFNHSGNSNSPGRIYPQLPTLDQQLPIQYPQFNVPTVMPLRTLGQSHEINTSFDQLCIPPVHTPSNDAPLYSVPYQNAKSPLYPGSNTKTFYNVQYSVADTDNNSPIFWRHSYAYECSNGPTNNIIHPLNSPQTNAVHIQNQRKLGYDKPLPKRNSYMSPSSSNPPCHTISTAKYRSSGSSQEYTRISPHLYDKIKKNRQSVSVPFYYKSSSGGQNGSGPSALESSPDDPYWMWKDPNYLSLPHSPLNKIPGKIIMNWEEIVRSLTHLRHNFHRDANANVAKMMVDIVSTYCPDVSQKSNFLILNRKELARDLVQALPYIIDFALLLPSLLAEPIPLLKTGQNKTIYLTRKLCCSLLANAFFCTFPESSLHSKSNRQLPDFNFFRLFHDFQSGQCHVKVEKIKCLLNYFRTFLTLDTKVQHQIVSFERRCVHSRLDWGQLTTPLCKVKIETRGKIEEAECMLQVDFANKLIGGGVLGKGCVMEEIRFCISPELIVSRLFTEIMDGNEAVVITGSQIYSEYQGYSTTFKYVGACRKGFDANTDGYGRTLTQVVAMDAVNFKKHNAYRQYDIHYIDRELHKSWVAFINGSHGSPVATGNWGCGAFNGDPELKFLIQWMAASHQDRKKLVYHTFGDQKQAKDVQEMVSFLAHRNVTVGELYRVVTKCHSRKDKSVFHYVYDKVGASGGGIIGIGKDVISSIRDVVSKM